MLPVLRQFVEGLHAQALGIGIATVPGGTAAFGLGHRTLLGLGRDLGDLDARVVLTMTPTLALDRLRLVGESPDLRALLLAKDRAGDGRAFSAGPATTESPSTKGRVRTGFRHHSLPGAGQRDDLALGDALLRCAYTDNGVHRDSIVAD